MSREPSETPDGREVNIQVDENSKYYHQQPKHENEENKDSFSDSEVFNRNNIRYEPSSGHKRLHCDTKYNKQKFEPFTFLNAMFDMYKWLHVITQVMMKRSQQTMISFILGLVVGITLTALLFQQNILFGHSANLKSDSLLGNGFMFRTFPISKAQVMNQDNQMESLPKLHRDFSQDYKYMDSSHNAYTHFTEEVPQSSLPSKIKSEVNVGAKVFVGVITAEKFLSSRAIAVNSTWGTQVDKISFFTELGTSEEYGIPVVNLDGVSDKEYPPQKKAFKMLKHMCQNHINEYDWFIRADDDVYIRVEKLKQFLGQIDSDKLIYMGQPGHGVPEVREKLGLNGHNFCMGGPSVIFNRKALKKLCSHLDECMTEVVSGEEDVEIGRCVSNHLHIECTHAWETLKLFYHSYQEEYTEEKPFLGNLAENIHVEKAITLHHVKVPYIMYKIHRHFTSQLLNSSTQAISHLRKQAHSMNELLPPAKHRVLKTVKIPPQPYKARRSSDVPVWKSFSVESIFGLSPAIPDRDITNDHLADLKQIGETAIDAAIDRSSSHLTYSHLSGGYFRSDPLRGTDYMLDIAFSSKEEGKHDEVKRVHLLRPLSDFKVSANEELPKKGPKIHFYVVLPLLESLSVHFETFMRKYYEPSILQPQNDRRFTSAPVTLIVSIYEQRRDEFSNSQESSPSVYDIVSWYRVKYPHSNIEIVPSSSSDNKINDQVTMSRDVTYAYSQGLSRAMDIQESLAGVGFGLLSTSNFSISIETLNTCVLHSLMLNSPKNSDGAGEKETSVEKLFFYQPIPFTIYPAVSASSNFNNEIKFQQLKPKRGSGYWDLKERSDFEDLNLPICATLENLLSITDRSHSGVKSQILSSIHQNIFNSNNFILRVPDKSMINVPGR